MPEFMPVVRAHPIAGTLKAVGQVTGTHYVIGEQGSWVYLEDLPGLLAEKRDFCSRSAVPKVCFAEIKASQTQAVPYRPWQEVEVATEEPLTEITVPEALKPVFSSEFFSEAEVSSPGEATPEETTDEEEQETARPKSGKKRTRKKLDES